LLPEQGEERLKPLEELLFSGIAPFIDKQRFEIVGSMQKVVSTFAVFTEKRVVGAARFHAKVGYFLGALSAAGG
jgi:hypothetical protein